MSSLPRCPNCNSSKKVNFKYRIDSFKIYICQNCLNGFTYPWPLDLAKYYHSGYWIFPGLIGLIRLKVYNFFQLRRKQWIQNYLKSGHILDVGSGEGLFGKSLSPSFKITNLDYLGAKIKNKNILKKDFLKWRTNSKFEAIVFWESLEHTPRPFSYLKKARSLLKKEGYIFIEYPVFECFESKLYKKYWFHLDPPRHLSHLTSSGIEYLARKSGFKILLHKAIFAPEYVSIGFVASFVNLFNLSSSTIPLSNRNYLILLLTPLGIFSLIIEYFFFLLNQSPIRLIVLKNRNEI